MPESSATSPWSTWGHCGTVDFCWAKVEIPPVRKSPSLCALLWPCQVTLPASDDFTVNTVVLHCFSLSCATFLCRHSFTSYNYKLATATDLCASANSHHQQPSRDHQTIPYRLPSVCHHSGTPLAVQAQTAPWVEDSPYDGLEPLLSGPLPPTSQFSFSQEPPENQTFWVLQVFQAFWVLHSLPSIPNFLSLPNLPSPPTPPSFPRLPKLLCLQFRVWIGLYIVWTLYLAELMRSLISLRLPERVRSWPGRHSSGASHPS